MEHQDNKDEVGNDVPPAPQIPTIDWNVQVSDKHGNPVNVLLEPPNPPPFHFDASWGTREQWKELAEEWCAYHIVYNKFHFERDRQRQLALGQHREDGSTSNQPHEPSYYNPGEDSPSQVACKRQATSQDGADSPTTNP